MPEVRGIAPVACLVVVIAVGAGAQSEPSGRTYRALADALIDEALTLIDEALTLTATDSAAAAALIERALAIDPDSGDAMVLAARYVYTEQADTRTRSALLERARGARLRRIDRGRIAAARAESMLAIGAPDAAIEIVTGAIVDDLAKPRAAELLAGNRPRAATALRLVGALAGEERLHRLEHLLLTALVAAPSSTAARLELGAVIASLRARFPTDARLAEIDLTRGDTIDIGALEWLAGGAAAAPESARRVIEARGFPPGPAGAALFAHYRELGGDDPLTMVRSGRLDAAEATALAGADVQMLRLTIATAPESDAGASPRPHAVPSPAVSDRDRDGRYDALLYHDRRRVTHIAFDVDEDGVHERVIAWGPPMRLVERDERSVTVLDLLDGRLVSDVWRFDLAQVTDERLRISDVVTAARRWRPPLPVALDLGEPFRARYLQQTGPPELADLIAVHDPVAFRVAGRFDRQLAGADARDPDPTERDEVWRWLGEHGTVTE